MPYIPHTPEDTAAMLEYIGADTIDTLFDEIPVSLLHNVAMDIPVGMSAMRLLQKAAEWSSGNRNGTCFMGAGSYDHHIPAAVWDIASRGEFLTAYTPYQAEASQGTLQLLYEYQTMIAELTGMEVANASLYDGASALAEAVLMAMRLKKQITSHRVLVVGTLHPLYRETVDTLIQNQSIELITLPFDKEKGTTICEALENFEGGTITALIMVQPNFFGCLEDVDTLTDWAYKHGVIRIACVNPLALSLLKPPGQWGQHGVDIVCGEGQSLGVPMASGGPYFGFFSTQLAHVRQMPGRLTGKTLDAAGKPGFTLTLQAREQHIRREKATSNICTNQGLLVTAATVYMSLLGPEGLAQTARNSHSNTLCLVERLTSLKGVRRACSGAFFHECVLVLDYPVETVLDALDEQGINGGYGLYSHFPQLGNALLVCATEKRTKEEINTYYHALQGILQALEGRTHADF